MLLNHAEINALLANNVVTGTCDGAVNSASLDIHLGHFIMVETGTGPRNVDFRNREALSMTRIRMGLAGYTLLPGQFMLAQSEEVFNMPDNVSATYKAKSSMARIGLEHLNAGWIDAGWTGSVLTLEFKNMTQHHGITLHAGDAIGQIVFFRHAAVHPEASYAKRGRYNGDTTVSGIKA